MAIKGLAIKDVEYQVTFRVQKEVNYGESIGVLGSITELGKWKDCIHHLKWTEGNIWESTTPITTNSFYFMYKYVVLVDGGTM